MSLLRSLLVLCLIPLLSACPGSGTSNGNIIPQSSDASLSALSISTGSLDQVFQSSQPDYSATVGYLATAIQVTATTSDTNASLTINGQPVASGTPSAPIPLAEGPNAAIPIVVTAGDGTTQQTYTLTLTRELAASFAQQAYLKASNAQANDQFGFSVALSGDTLVVGAPYEAGDASSTAASPNDNVTDAGAAYVFTRDAGGAWSQQAYLKASNAEAGDQFGWRVSIDGDTTAVGDPNEDSSATGGETDNSAAFAGAAYIWQ